MNNDLNNGSENNNSSMGKKYFTNTENQYRVKDPSTIIADDVFSGNNESIQQSLNNMYNNVGNENTTQQNNDVLLNEHNRLTKLRMAQSVKSWIVDFLKLILLFIVSVAGLFGILLIVISLFFGFNLDGTSETDNTNNTTNNSNSIFVENAIITESRCLNYKCSFIIKDSTGNKNEYTIGIEDEVLLGRLINYNDYIKLNIYYNEGGSDRIIVDYKLFLKSTNEDVSDVKTEDELREKLGLFTIGTHTESLKLAKAGATGIGKRDNETYSYAIYTFVDNKNYEYNMFYLNGELNLIEGQNYNVTFEANKGEKEYEFIIKSIS